jgi:hypothetical protein
LVARLSEIEARGENWSNTTAAESSSTRLSELKASKAGLCARAAASSDTPHSTILQTIVMA